MPLQPHRGRGLARVARGAASGAVATVAMSTVMVAARTVGLVPQPAPEMVTTNALRRAGADDAVRPPARTAVVGAAHMAFGAAAGALYALAAPRSRPAGAATGTLFGLGVWAVSYLGWLPALRLVPPPSRQGDGRHVEIVASHVVYGTVLGSLTAG